MIVPFEASILLALRGGLLRASPRDARKAPADWGEKEAGVSILPLGDKDVANRTIPSGSLDPDLDRKSSILPHTGISGTVSAEIINVVPGVPLGVPTGVAIKKFAEFAELLELSCLDKKLYL